MVFWLKYRTADFSLKKLYYTKNMSFARQPDEMAFLNTFSQFQWEKIYKKQ